MSTSWGSSATRAGPSDPSRPYGCPHARRASRPLARPRRSSSSARTSVPSPSRCHRTSAPSACSNSCSAVSSLSWSSASRPAGSRRPASTPIWSTSAKHWAQISLDPLDRVAPTPTAGRPHHKQDTVSNSRRRGGGGRLRLDHRAARGLHRDLRGVPVGVVQHRRELVGVQVVDVADAAALARLVDLVADREVLSGAERLHHLVGFPAVDRAEDEPCLDPQRPGCPRPRAAVGHGARQPRVPGSSSIADTRRPTGRFQSWPSTIRGSRVRRVGCSARRSDRAADQHGQSNRLRPGGATGAGVAARRNGERPSWCHDHGVRCGPSRVHPRVHRPRRAPSRGRSAGGTARRCATVERTSRRRACRVSRPPAISRHQSWRSRPTGGGPPISSCWRCPRARRCRPHRSRCWMTLPRTRTRPTLELPQVRGRADGGAGTGRPDPPDAGKGRCGAQR